MAALWWATCGGGGGGATTNKTTNNKMPLVANVDRGRHEDLNREAIDARTAETSTSPLVSSVSILASRFGQST